MSTTVTYKGSTLTTASNQTKVLETAGKYLEDDITVVDSVSLQAKTVTYTPTESQQTATVTADSGYEGLSSVGVTVNRIKTENRIVNPGTSQNVVTPSPGYYLTQVTVNAMPSGTAGTPTATKGTVSNHSVSVTPSVTNTTGYITGSTKTGTAVSVSASELVSGTYAVDSSGTKDVTNYASVSVPSGTEGTPSASKGTVSNHSVTITPSVTNTTGWITGSTKTGTGVTVSASELVSGSDTVTENDTYDVTNLAELVVNVPTGGGSVTITDEPNATGTTLVITTSGEPTPSGIPLNTELIDFTEITEDYAIDSSGEAVAAQWYCASDYTAVDASMTFTYTGCTWYYIGVYDSSKEHIRTIYMYTDGTQDPNNSNICTGTLSGSKIAGASYVRITGVAVGSEYRLSLIRTA